MDTTKTITHVSLCAGYGGIDLGLKRAIPNLRTIAFSEIEAFAVANLVSKMEAGLLDSAPIWTNLKTFPWGKFRGVVDILSGGYPCQPFSAAGKRLGTEDPRHLWPYIADGIAAMRPSVCFFENVEGHISLGLPDVIEDMGRLGYRTTWGIFSASEVGAPHQRKRVFILAYLVGKGLQGFSADPHQNTEGWKESNGHTWASGLRDREQPWPSRPGQPQYAWEPPRVVENPNLIRRGRWSDGDEGRVRGEIQVEGSRCGREQISEAEPSLGGDPNGSSCGVGHAELRKPDHADCGTDGEHWGELGDTKHPGSHGTEIGGSINSASADEQSRKIQAIQSSGTSEPRGGEDLRNHDDLYTSCDNRTDELRLLGNGVVPATAELAWRTLWDELIK